MDVLETDGVGLYWIGTRSNLADVLTKPSATPWFLEFRQAIMVDINTEAEDLNSRAVAFVERFGKTEWQSGEIRELF